MTRSTQVTCSFVGPRQSWNLMEYLLETTQVIRTVAKRSHLYTITASNQSSVEMVISDYMILIP